MKFKPGFTIQPLSEPLSFRYGEGVFGPLPEYRTLDSIRANLMDLSCDGPDIVYSIAMDVGNVKDRPQMLERNLLYGAVTYAKGRLGKEPVRSQGHIHAVSASCGSSTGELYEIWDGKACIYMQESAAETPGRCYAVMAEPGNVVLVPPAWAHCTIVADVAHNMTFGAWCVRDYGFAYAELRSRGGMAWFPLVAADGGIKFVHNERYAPCELIVKRPRIYGEFGLISGKPIYTQFTEDPDRFLFISKPQSVGDKWLNFVP